MIGKALVACEESQAVCIALRAKGWEAYSCDILPCSGGHPEWHIQGDVIHQLYNDWDLLIAHPPCTYLCNSGVRHFYDHVTSVNGKRAKVSGQLRFEEMKKAASLFQDIQKANCSLIAIENPIPHKFAKEIVGNYTQLIQPWQYGHGETKATCLWLKGLPKLIPTDIVEGRVARIHKMPPSKDRAKLRSKTYPGIAAAIANQWTNFYIKQILDL